MSEETFWKGIEEFNQQNFYSCHDIFEALWVDAEHVDKKFYQGVLQIAVACYHLGNHNWRGAVVLLGEGINRLSSYQPTYYDINITQLVQESYHLLQGLQQIKPEQVEEFVNQLQPPERAVNKDINAETSAFYQLPQIQIIKQ